MPWRAPSGSVRGALGNQRPYRDGDGNRDAVGPGMSLWTIFVLGMLKRRLGCDFDRLREHANTHLVLRQLLGHGEYDPVEYSYDTVLRDISLLDEDTLRAIGDLAGTVRNPVVPGLIGTFSGLRRQHLSLYCTKS